MTAQPFRLVIISGRSGSGKSTVLNTLEDAGFTCIDNLPPPMLPELVGWMSASSGNRQVAVCVDVRVSSEGITDLPEILRNLPNAIKAEVLFLDADESILLQRFSATRRKHPLTNEDRSLAEAIEREAELLAPISNRADLKIDTSLLSLQEFREQIKEKLIEKPKGLSLQFLSFGFKHGIPKDADLVFDVRCLPNPFWEKSLRQFTGRDKPIQEFLQKETSVNEMFDDIVRFVARWLPEYENNQRSYLTVAIGCTGGQHRSVYLVEQLTATFKAEHPSTQIRHRDLGNDH
ncbi:RNase adapter RapZ [Reinekea marina]|uniref:RNase adapter RapZ n=2 Tax=Reinekea marina TaxID=1310421 RepID=A0ABV7WRG7_9GAMM|nr:RNase adapter RapZ [Reinekea forsetii]